MCLISDRCPCQVYYFKNYFFAAYFLLVLLTTTTDDTEDTLRKTTALTDGPAVHTAASSVLGESGIQQMTRSAEVKQEINSLEDPTEVENDLGKSRGSGHRQTGVVAEHVPMCTRGRWLNQGSVFFVISSSSSLSSSSSSSSSSIYCAQRQHEKQ